MRHDYYQNNNKFTFLKNFTYPTLKKMVLQNIFYLHLKQRLSDSALLTFVGVGGGSGAHALVTHFAASLTSTYYMLIASTPMLVTTKNVSR